MRKLTNVTNAEIQIAIIVVCVFKYLFSVHSRNTRNTSCFMNPVSEMVKIFNKLNFLSRFSMLK